MRQTQMKLEGGTIAKLGGRYTFKRDGETKFLHIYYVEKDQAYKSNDNSTVVLTPTASWTHDLGDEPWQRYHKNGVEQIVLSKETWNEIKQADEVENFNPEDYTFVSNRTNEVTGRLPRETPEEKSIDKKLDNISEKVAQKMSEDNNNSTFSMFKEAGFDAAKMVGANQANELISNGIKKALKSIGLTHDFIESEAGHKLVKILGPLAIHYAADTQAEFINGLVGENASANIKEGCKFATQAAIGDIMEPILTIVAPLLTDLATMGAKSLKGTFTPGAVEDSKDSIEQMMRQKESMKASA